MFVSDDEISFFILPQVQMTASIPARNSNVILYVYQLERRTILVSVLIIYRKKGIRVNARPQKHWLMENVDFVSKLILVENNNNSAARVFK